MRTKAHRWVIVLAAGDGNRLRSFTSRATGKPTPKQFFALPGRRSMLQETLDRARRLVPHERIVVVVAAQHREWWETELQDLPPDNVVVQPQNRGTAAGVLLPLLVIDARDPKAEVVIMPSDHFVGRTDVFTSAIEEALVEAVGSKDRIVLLGVAPETDDPDYGWILPVGTPASGASTKVMAFVEKPDARSARELMRRGALVNAFLIAARSRALLRLYDPQPRLLETLRPIVAASVVGTSDAAALARSYESMENLDFSRDLLQLSPLDGLRVLPIPPCGWSDLGTPERLVACLDRSSGLFAGTGTTDGKPCAATPRSMTAGRNWPPAVWTGPLAGGGTTMRTQR
ncbi:MAG: NTP transferase domain-containing protein [Thermoanaerobaculia bacterium]|nr:NTP transferase domain-containing protein [Thermoanaerobaculia bacterium]